MARVVAETGLHNEGLVCRYCHHRNPRGLTQCERCRALMAPPEGRLRVIDEYTDEVQEGERPEDVSRYLHRLDLPDFQGPSLASAVRRTGRRARRRWAGA